MLRERQEGNPAEELLYLGLPRYVYFISVDGKVNSVCEDCDHQVIRKGVMKEGCL